MFVCVVQGCSTVGYQRLPMSCASYLMISLTRPPPNLISIKRISDDHKSSKKQSKVFLCVPTMYIMVHPYPSSYFLHQNTKRFWSELLLYVNYYFNLFLSSSLYIADKKMVVRPQAFELWSSCMPWLMCPKPIMVILNYTSCRVGREREMQRVCAKHVRRMNDWLIIYYILLLGSLCYNINVYELSSLNG